VQLVNLGIPGWQSADLRNATHSRFLFRLSIFVANVVTWNIGGNDLSAARNKYKAGTCGGPLNQDCLTAAVSSFRSNWDGIIRDLFALRRARPTVFRTMTIYNPFVKEDKDSDSWSGDGGLTDFQALAPYLDQVNNYIRATASLGVMVAPVHEAFNGPGGDEDAAGKGLISFDGYHANGRGHAVMAALLRSLGYAAIVP
jgi:lysophospholipase L1-like esterase